MRSLLITVSFILAALHGNNAEAKPRRVVVLEFDGPRRLADSGRAAVMGVLGDQYNIVATKNWASARARANGGNQWRQASKQAGVDAVIEGWVQAEGRHHVLTIAVREAATGRELDTLSVRLKEEGVTPEASQKLAVQLDDLLSWIDGDINADPTPTLPDIRSLEPKLGATNPDRNRRRLDDDDFDRNDRDSNRSGRGRKSRSDRDDDRDRDEARDDRRDDRDDRRDDRDDDRRDDRREDTRKGKADEPKQEVANLDADRDTKDLVKLFGPESKEAEIVSEGKIAHKPKPTPRFIISGGPYLQARGMAFGYDPESKGSPPEYPGSPLKGFSASAAVYPMPREKQDGKISGVGFSLTMGHSVLSVLTAGDETGTGDFTLNHSTWETGVHYRWPIEFVSIDIDASYGNFSHTIVDLPESIQIPDTSYSYLGAGGRVDLQVTEGTTVGFGAHYMYLLSAGMVSEESWYGAGKAWGASLEGDFVIPITGALFVKGGIEYKRVKIDFEGSGMLSDVWGVWDIVDSSISGSGSLGVKF
jgi:hypothetical protein